VIWVSRRINRVYLHGMWLTVEMIKSHVTDTVPWLNVPKYTWNNSAGQADKKRTRRMRNFGEFDDVWTILGKLTPQTGWNIPAGLCASCSLSMTLSSRTYWSRLIATNSRLTARRASGFLRLPLLQQSYLRVLSNCAAINEVLTVDGSFLRQENVK